MMEKVGIQKEELLVELREKYTDLKARQMRVLNDPLQKEAAASIRLELEMVQSKIDELANDAP